MYGPRASRRSRPVKSIRYVALVASLAGTASADKPPPKPEFSPDEASSLRHFERARGLFRGRDYHAAIAEFELAYDARPSPVILHNLGACYEQLFKYAKAIEFYERYLAAASAVEQVPIAKRTPQQRDEVNDLVEIRRRIGQIKSVTGFLSVRTVQPGALVTIDGDDVGKTPIVVRLGAGTHRAEVSLPKMKTAAFSFSLEPVVTLDKLVELEPLPTSRGTPRWVFQGAAGATAVAGLASVFFGARYLSARSDYQGSTDGRTPDNADLARSRGRTANLLLGVTGVLGVSTGVLYFTTDWRPASGDAPAARAGMLTFGGRM